MGEGINGVHCSSLDHFHPCLYNDIVTLSRVVIAWLQEGVGVCEVGCQLVVAQSVIQTLGDHYNDTRSVAE